MATTTLTPNNLQNEFSQRIKEKAHIHYDRYEALGTKNTLVTGMVNRVAHHTLINFIFALVFTVDFISFVGNGPNI